jgi:hypothetical protein
MLKPYIMNPYLGLILKKMCDVVGADSEKIDFKSADWFLMYTWTKAQETEFREWMTDYLVQNKQARVALMNFPGRKQIKKTVDAFIWNYGWRENG